MYGSNLMAVSKLVSFTIPADAFLEAIEGVRTPSLRRLVSKARIASYNADIEARAQQSIGAERPFTAAGVEGERSLNGNVLR